MAFLASALVLEKLLRATPETSGPDTPGVRSPAPGLCALAGLLFIAPGSLAPPCNTAWGGIAWFALLAASMRLERRAPFGRERDRATMMMAASAIAVLAWTVWRRGVPGSPLNFGTYAAMPLWEILDLRGTAGLALLLAGLLLVRPSAPPGEAAFAARIRRLSWCAFLAAVFVPNPMESFNASAALTVAGDYGFFWSAVLGLYRLPLPEGRRGAFCAVLCGLAGTMLLLVSLHNTVGILTAGAS